MSETTQCPECGAQLSKSATGGLCPKCLMGAGLGSDAEQPGSAFAATTPQAGGFVPPEPDELKALFPQLEIIELLGHGGMGAVYKARQTNLDRPVALKIIRPESADDPTFAERFMREARTLARLNHPNIVAVHDFGEATNAGSPAVPNSRPADTSVEETFGRPGGSVGDRPQQTGDRPQPLYYFIMEYVDGLNLRQLMQTGELHAEQALSIVPQICDALQFAHDAGIIHRDIKPENILVDKQGRVKIADYGLAKLARPQLAPGDSPGGKYEDFTLTGTHQVMGTPRYMAPEQMEGSHTVDHRADIYSLGVVFYEMLTGELPMGQFEPPSRKTPIDARLDEVVMRALAREPERRFQQASEVKSQIEAISSHPSDSRPALSAVTPPPQPVGISTIAEREVQNAWRWIAGDSNETAEQRPTLPALLMIVLSLAGCLMLFLPWMDLEIEKSIVVRTVSVQLNEPVARTLFGTDRWPGTATAAAFVCLALLVISTPGKQPPTVWRTVLMTGIAAFALLHTFLFRMDFESGSYPLSIARARGVGSEKAGAIVDNMTPDAVYVSDMGDPPLSEIDHRITYREGFYGSLGLSLGLLLLSAVGVRHAVGQRGETQPERKRRRQKTDVPQLGGSTSVGAIVLRPPPGTPTGSGISPWDVESPPHSGETHAAGGRDWVVFTREEVECDRLPDLCMVCGKPTRERVNKTFEHQSNRARSLSVLALLLGIVPGFIVMVLTTKRIRVACPVCHQHRRHWSRLVWLASTGWLLMFLLGAVGYFVAMAAYPFEDGPQAVGAAIGAVIGLIVYLVPVIYLTSTRVAVKSITNNTVRFHRVAGAFANAVAGKEVVARRGSPAPSFSPSEGLPEEGRECRPAVANSRPADASVEETFGRPGGSVGDRPQQARRSERGAGSGERRMKVSLPAPHSDLRAPRFKDDAAVPEVSSAFPDLDMRRIEMQLKGPAGGLIVTAILGVVFWCGWGAFMFYDEYRHAGGPPAPFQIRALVTVVVSATVLLLLFVGTTIRGALKMRRMASYEWSMVACILAMIPWSGTVYLLSLPIGIWAFRTLRRPDVRDAFIARAIANERVESRSQPRKIVEEENSENAKWLWGWWFFLLLVFVVLPSAYGLWSGLLQDRPDVSHLQDVTSEGPISTDALMQAAKEGNVGRIKILLDAGADVNDKDANGQTALMHAAYYGHASLATTLVLLGANVNEPDAYRQTPVMLAAQNGHVAVLQGFKDVDAASHYTDEKERKARLKQVAGVDKRLLAETDIDLRNLEIDYDAQDLGGETALMKAAAGGHATAVEILLFGSDETIQDERGRTALMHAVVNRRLAFFRRLSASRTKLLGTGAGGIGYNSLLEPNIVSISDHEGQTVFQLAEKAGHAEIAEILKTEMQRAIDHMTQAISNQKKSPGSFTAYEFRGHAYLALGEKAKAEADFEKAKELKESPQ